MKKALLSAGTAEQHLCCKPVRELCWTCRFSYFELIYYIVRQSQLQTDADISKCGNFITKWNKNYYKVGQLHIIDKSCYKVQQVIYYKVGKSLLQSLGVITKSYHKELSQGRAVHRSKLHRKVGQKILLPSYILLICLIGTRTKRDTHVYK